MPPVRSITLGHGPGQLRAAAPLKLMRQSRVKDMDIGEVREEWAATGGAAEARAATTMAATAATTEVVGELFARGRRVTQRSPIVGAAPNPHHGSGR